MSLWRFTYIASDGEETEIENPKGWDNPVVNIDRDDNWHGVFFGYTPDKYEYHGLGAQLIKAEYDANGVSGSGEMRIDFMCSEDGTWDQFYRGRLEFTDYEDTCGDECLVTIGLEDANDVMLLKNNIKQSVDLLSNIAFDGTTELTDYDQLNVSITLPERAIQQRTSGAATGQHPIYPLTYPLSSPLGTEFYIRPSYAVGPVEEIAASDMLGQSTFGVRLAGGFVQEMSPQLILAEGQVIYGLFNYSLRMKGRIREVDMFTRQMTLRVLTFAGDAPDDPLSDPTLLHNDLIVDDAPVAGGATFDQTFDISHSGTVVLAPGQVFFVCLYLFNSEGNNTTDPPTEIRVDWDSETFVEIKAESNFPSTEGKVWMVNEAISRVAEAITNDQIRFYSESFGRADSQPYPAVGYPCPGLMYLANGLNIRNKLLANGDQPSFFITLDKLYNDLRAIWNIGMTIEPDLNRAGFNRLRFEDWRFFYQDELGINFTGATEIKRKVDLERVFNRFEVGYAKWEAETFTGLDEFMTKREYRLNINSVDSILSMLSEIIASPYALEVTRRFGNQSQDWKYDNDVFTICVNPDDDGYTVPYLIEEGYGIENIYDPESCYNQRIDPVRNAMRWFNYVMQGYRQFQQDTRLIFTKADGNYIAEYGLDGNCAIDSKVMVQNEDVDLPDFADMQQAKPITFPELITFEHPLNYNMFKRLKDDPSLKYKSVNVYCNGNAIPGWIKSISYRAGDGQATITVIPKNYTQLPEIIPPAGCEATVITDSVMLTDFDYSTKTAVLDFTEGVSGATLWRINLIRLSPLSNSIFDITEHPYTIEGVTPGEYQVIVIPYCDADNIGANVASGSATFATPPLNIELRLQYLPGSVIRKIRIVATPVGEATFTSLFSFRYGQCAGGFCNGFPSSPTNPLLYSTITGIQGNPSAQADSNANIGASATVDRVVLSGLVGITPGQISKAAGEAGWTLEFE
jgi:hypothetical protein